MRLLIVADKLTGGAGNVAQQLASCFSQKEDNVVFLMIEANTKPKYDLSKVNIFDRKITPVKLTNPIKKITRYITKSRMLRNTINDCSADVIISFLNSISPEVLFSQWRTKTPIIVSERSNPYFEWEKKTFLDKLKWWLSYRRANLIVYQFKCFEPFFKFAYKKNNTRAIPNMVFDPAVSSEHKNSIIPYPIKFASVATLYPVKRINLMIDIFAELKKKCPEIELNIYGDGPDRVRLEHQVVQKGLQDSVHFHGHTTDISSSLYQNHVLLMTSEREGFPNVIIEAMNVGVPTVTFKYHDGIGEIVSDGINGVLIEQNNIKAYMDKLEFLVKNPYVIANMGEKGLAMCKKFDKENVVQMWQECIESVCNL